MMMFSFGALCAFIYNDALPATPGGVVSRIKHHCVETATLDNTTTLIDTNDIDTPHASIPQAYVGHRLDCGLTDALTDKTSHVVTRPDVVAYNAGAVQRVIALEEAKVKIFELETALAELRQTQDAHAALDEFVYTQMHRLNAKVREQFVERRDHMLGIGREMSIAFKNREDLMLARDLLSSANTLVNELHRHESELTTQVANILWLLYDRDNFVAQYFTNAQAATEAPGPQPTAAEYANTDNNAPQPASPA